MARGEKKRLKVSEFDKVAKLRTNRWLAHSVAKQVKYDYVRSGYESKRLRVDIFFFNACLIHRRR